MIRLKQASNTPAVCSPKANNDPATVIAILKSHALLARNYNDI